MGTRGPAPKRPSQRRRKNAPPQETTKAAADPGTIAAPYPANSRWHPVAKRWFDSLERSGQAAFYEASDWATAYLIGEAISRELKPQPVVDKEGFVTMVTFPPKGASLAAWLKGMTSLLATEGDRRRAALELQRPNGTDPEEGDADVSELSEFRRRLRQSP